MEVESLYPSDQIVSKEIPDNPDMTRYIKELKEDLVLNQRNLKEKSLMVSALKSKWLNYYFLEKSNLKRIKAKRDEIIRSKLSTGVQKSILPLKNTEKIANEDENVKKLDILNERVKSNIDFLERAMNIINDFSYSIRNSIDILKLERM
jgi:hypothetical protein